MRVPQVSERIKEVPAQALRGVFAGIGQLLLITDKLRNKPPAGPPRARTPERSKPVADAPASEPVVSPVKATEPAPGPPAGAKSSSVKSAKAKPDTAKAAAVKPARTEAPKSPPTSRVRDFDKTGNVRLLHDAETSAPAAPVVAAVPETAAAPAGAPAAGSEPGDSGPPLPNYDELSVASLRARLRNLDAAQVRRLAEYERAHAARADVITMFERRIAKLEAGA
jgi:cytoskeletal protein RodZ